jgi:hypothetical protein
MICGMHGFAMKAENREMMLGKGDGYVLLSTQQARSSKLHLPANHICQRTTSASEPHLPANRYLDE